MYIVRINKTYEYMKYTAVLSDYDSQMSVLMNIDGISIYRSIDDVLESIPWFTAAIEESRDANFKKFSETDMFNMFDFMIDDIFVMFGGPVF